MTSHDAEHEAAFPIESIFNEYGSTEDSKIIKAYDETAGASRTKTPEEVTIEYENLQTLKNELDILSNGNEDMGMVILCIEDGVSEPRNIADMTGFEIGKINNLLRKLRRKLEPI